MCVNAKNYCDNALVSILGLLPSLSFRLKVPLITMMMMMLVSKVPYQIHKRSQNQHDFATISHSSSL